MDTTFVRAALIAGAIAVVPLVASPGEAAAATCPSTMVFAINGVDGNPAQVPGAPHNVPRTNVYYRNDLHSVVTDPVGTRRSGERALTSAITKYRAKCPDSHVRVYAHSYGSWVAGNVRDSKPAVRRNSSWVLVSDPRSKMGVLRLAPSIPGYFDAQGSRGKAKAPTASTCRTTDGVCWEPNPVVDPVGAVNGIAGYLTGAHGYRGDEVRQSPGVTVHRGTPVFVVPTQTPAVVSVPAAPVVSVDAYVPEPVEPIIPVAVKDLPVPAVVSNVLDGLGLRVK